jgi:hypothetical protein
VKEGLTWLLFKKEENPIESRFHAGTTQKENKSYNAKHGNLNLI